MLPVSDLVLREGYGRDEGEYEDEDEEFKELVESLVATKFNQTPSSVGPWMAENSK